MRPTNVIGLGTCVVSLLFAYFWLERYMGLHPCPLCILDRIVVALMGVVFFAGLFTTEFRARMALTGVNMFFLAWGFLFAGRHVWIQNQPHDPRAECLWDAPQVSGIVDLVREAFSAYTDCSLIGWEVFGLSIPGMVLAMFGFLFVLLCLQTLGTYQDAHGDDDD